MYEAERLVWTRGPHLTVLDITVPLSEDEEPSRGTFSPCTTNRASAKVDQTIELRYRLERMHRATDAVSIVHAALLHGYTCSARQSPPELLEFTTPAPRLSGVPYVSRLGVYSPRLRRRLTRSRHDRRAMAPDGRKHTLRSRGTISTSRKYMRLRGGAEMVVGPY